MLSCAKQMRRNITSKLSRENITGTLLLKLSESFHCKRYAALNGGNRRFSHPGNLATRAGKFQYCGRRYQESRNVRSWGCDRLVAEAVKKVRMRWLRLVSIFYRPCTDLRPLFYIFRTSTRAPTYAHMRGWRYEKYRMSALFPPGIFKLRCSILIEFKKSFGVL